MNKKVAALLLGVGDAETYALADQHAGIADLAAGLTVEWRLVEDDCTALTSRKARDLLAVLDQCGHHALGGLGLITKEFGRAEFFSQWKPDSLGRGLAGARPRCPRLLALTLHGVAERGDIDADAARTQRILGQVEREAVGVVQRERGLAVEHVALFQAAALLVENGKTALQGLAKAGLFQLQRLGDQRLGANQLRVSLSHLADQ